MEVVIMFEYFLSKRKIKLFLISLVIGVCVTSHLQVYSRNVVDGISDNVVRLHIVANSDTDEDQSLKLKVRDEITSYLKPMLDNATNVEESKKILADNLEGIEEEAERAIKKYGYTYGVTVSLGNFDFPTKEYGDVRFPKGNYDALKIVIENGNGKNWWCVLYPQLCFSENVKGVLPEESDAKLKKSLSDEQYDVITNKSKINFKFKIVEWFST